MADISFDYYQNVNAASRTGGVSFDASHQGSNVDNQAIMSAKTGETLEGNVVNIENNEALIRLSDNSLISATLSGDVNITPGQNVLFESNHRIDGAISLRALSTHLDDQSPATDALNQAGLEADNVTLKMISDMMHSGMSIDRDSLLNMYRVVSSNPDIPQTEIVNMTALGIEPTVENLSSFDAVMNYRDTLSESFDSLFSAFPEEVSSLLGEGRISEGFELASKMFESLLPEGFSDDAAQIASGKVFLAEENVLSENGATDYLSVLKEAMANSLSPRDELNSLLDSLGLDSSKFTAENGNQDMNLINELNVLLKNGEIPADKLSKLFKNEEFGNILKNEMTKTWLLEPKDMDKPGSVNEYYNKLNSRITELTERISDMVPKDGNLAKAVDNMSAKVDFLNNLNNFMPYIQLPLKMNSEARTGDLYVYSNKRNLSETDNDITALLHLDMTYLGKMDVFVCLKDESKVTTDFTLESEEIIDFFEDRMDLLTERLAKRGYEVATSIKKADEDKSLSDRINDGFPGAVSKAEETSNSKNLLYRFDVRA
ncbi:MAG: flagellar hook-length control protein FliK [Lachnospiraceae bacterium]|nr:flagellar hook-length control protein FliK [Lachnospiraceae bacterium]